MTAYNNYYEALCNAGAAPFLVESAEAEEWLKNYVENHENTEILPGDEDFEEVCALLDLTPENNPKRVFRCANYNEEAIYYALSQDWEFA